MWFGLQHGNSVGQAVFLSKGQSMSWRCPTRNAGDWDADVVEVGGTVLTHTVKRRDCYFELYSLCHDVRRRIALGKEAFDKKSDLMRGSLSLHLKNKKRMVKALFRVLRCMEAKRGLYKKKIFGDLKHLKYGYGGE